MFEGVDTVILDDELAYEDVLPVAWRPLREPLDKVALASLTDRNVKTLQGCTAIEEQGPVDKQDDKSPNAADLQRLEGVMGQNAPVVVKLRNQLKLLQDRLDEMATAMAGGIL